MNSARSIVAPLQLDEPPLFLRDILVLSPTPTAPQDQGNRKRIYCICREFQRLGARIHFIYYPMEWWFTGLPQDALKEMQGQWDWYHLLPTTRPLHQRAQGEDHTIDEWWDPAIGDYLQWLFERQHFDAFVVNYAFLSKAFDYCPKGTLRILDTHDRFTGRRQLLEAQGIPREFFYTTQDQEAIALNRANLVWAIKVDEEEFFRTITKTPVITMPHVESAMNIERRASPEDEDYLVVGMLGARNAINVANSRAFVNQALPQIKRLLAPVKVRFAGGMCQELTDLKEIPGVELMGRVEQVEDFYRAIDLAIVPLTFSTGLKIKAVEAFAAGVPIIAHRHAVEGIPVEHRFHQCDSMDAIAGCILDVAYDRGLLDELRTATQETHLRIEEEARLASMRTVKRIIDQPTLIVALHYDFFNRQCGYREHALQHLFFLRGLGKLLFYFDQTPKAGGSALCELFNYLSNSGQIVFSPEANAADGQFYGLPHTTLPLAELAQHHPNAPLILLNLPNCLKEKPISRLPKHTPVMVRQDTLIEYLTVAPSELCAAFAGNRNVIVLDSLPETARDLCNWFGSDQVHSAKQMQIPFWREVPWQIRGRAHKNHIAILADTAALPLATAIARLCRAIDEEREVCLLVPVAASEDLENLGSTVAPQAGISTIPVVDIIADLEIMGRFPTLAIDLADNQSAFAGYRELLQRAEVTLLKFENIVSPYIERGQMAFTLRPTSLDQLVDTLTALLSAEADTELLNRARAERKALYGNDTGWTDLWREISTRFNF